MSSRWINDLICKKEKLDPDPHQNVTDPQRWLEPPLFLYRWQWWWGTASNSRRGPPDSAENSLQPSNCFSLLFFLKFIYVAFFKYGTYLVANRLWRIHSVLWIRDVYPGFVFFHPGSASKNLSFLNVFQALGNMIRVFIPDPGSGSWYFTHPGSQIQWSKMHRIPDPDPQHWIGTHLGRYKSTFKKLGIGFIWELLIITGFVFSVRIRIWVRVRNRNTVRAL